MIPLMAADEIASEKFKNVGFSIRDVPCLAALIQRLMGFVNSYR